MKKLKALIEKRNANLEAMGKMLDLCEAENRAFTDEEKKTYDTMMAETRSLADTIHAAEQVEGMSMEHEIDPAKLGSEARRQEAATKIETEERRAFEDYLRHGDAVTPGEQREATNMTKGANGAIIPRTIAQKIVKQVYNICPIYAKASHYNVKGQLDIPYIDTSAGDITVAYKDEFSELVSSANKFGSVTLTGFLIGALTLIGRSLINNSDFDVVSIVIDHMAENWARFIEKECLKGTTGKVTGALPGVTADQTVTAAKATALTADELIDVQEAVPDVYQQGAIWIMSKKTRAAIRKLKDNEGRYLLNTDLNAPWGYILLGKPVFASDSMDDMAAGKDAVLYGDMSGLAVKEIETMEIEVLREHFATQHAVGVVGWAELDAKVENAQKLAKLTMAAS